MNRSCHQCKRLNPPDAAYCYYDGVPLAGAAGEGGSIDFRTWTFPSPFVFPNGDKCSNFVQLAYSCRHSPEVAINVLQQGFLELFFGSVGRLDLATAAKAAAKAPDRDRGLDDLLGKLPGSSLEPAKLQVEPVEHNLGTVAVGQDRTFDVTMTNKGDRLVYGKATVDDDCPWLALGDSGAPEKIVQFFDTLPLQVRIRGDRLRAYGQTQKGQIILECNGGNATVTVRVNVPVKPFPDGVLAGAASPRKVAEKAKAHPKEAAVLLENGAVRRWYEDNGWPYPVQGPTASGLAAVQQFFEVLGLVKTPKVELTLVEVTLRGKVGERLESSVGVVTKEKRAAVAHGVSDQPWLGVGKTVFKGQTATIPLTVAEVPDSPGETLTAQVKVTANGNQRFDVPVTLIIANGAGAKSPPRQKVPKPEPEPEPVAASVEAEPSPFDFAAFGRSPPAPAVPEASSASVFAFTQPDTPPAPPPLPPTVASTAAVTEAAPLPKPALPVTLAGPVPPPLPPRPPRDWRKLLARLLPIGIVVLGLLTAVGRDLLHRGESAQDQPLPEIDFANPLLDVRFHDALQQSGEFVGTPSMRFGLGVPDPKDPKKFKTKLIYDDVGRTCNVCIRVDKKDFLWGVEQGAWEQPMKQDLGKDQKGNRLIGAKATWKHPNPPITVTQIVEIVPGGLSADGGKRLLDTCLVRYDITNADAAPHVLGLRFLLDTFIGSNDAVPFTIAGVKEPCSTMKSFDRPADVPDFISALEKQDLNNPGIVAHLSLKYGAGMEPPSRVTLGAWPAASLRKEPGGEAAQMFNTRWAVPVLPMDKAKSSENPAGDSAVTLYWDDKEVPPKETRTVGFAYGLGSVTGEKTGGLGLIAGGELVASKEFTLTAYVKNPAPGTAITLTLPRGLQLAGGTDKEAVPAIPPGSASPYSTVTWRVKAVKAGVHRVRVTLSTGAVLDHRVVIQQAQKITK